jgi:hypothetical protein
MSTVDDYQFSVRMLTRDDVRLFRTDPNDVRVRATLTDDRSYIDVKIARAYPFTKADRYIGLRDAAETDIGIIVDPSEMDAETQEIIRIELQRRYFTPRVEKILSVREEYGAVTFRVVTDRGERRFVVRNLRDNAYSLGPMRVMITDSDGNRYEFPDITRYGNRAFEVLAKVL